MNGINLLPSPFTLKDLTPCVLEVKGTGVQGSGWQKSAETWEIKKLLGHGRPAKPRPGGFHWTSWLHRLLDVGESRVRGDQPSHSRWGSAWKSQQNQGEHAQMRCTHILLYIINRYWARWCSKGELSTLNLYLRFTPTSSVVFLKRDILFGTRSPCPVKH